MAFDEAGLAVTGAVFEVLKDALAGFCGEYGVEVVTELYEPRWADPKFRAFAQAVAPNFFTRCKELFL